jgi:aspartyl/glutamyl-tRNA(Asn/Gln) amidotransferase C subunit
MTIEEIRAYEAMAKISLDDGTRSWALSAINSMEAGFKALSQADAQGAAPLVNALGDMRATLREDAAQKSIGRDRLLALAPDEYDGYFQAPRVVE